MRGEIENDSSGKNKEEREGEVKQDKKKNCGVENEKCNIKVIDLSMENSGKSQDRKKSDKNQIKVESLQETYCPENDKKFVKTSKVPDSSYKNAVNQKHQSSRTLTMPPSSGGCSRTTPVTFKHLTLKQEPEVKAQNGNVSPPIIKKEPMDFHKYPNNFLSLASLENLYNPNSLRIIDGQLLSPMTYSDESSSKRKENFLSPNTDTNLLSPRSVSETSYLSPKSDIGRDFKTYPTQPKIGEDIVTSAETGTMFSRSLKFLGKEENSMSQDRNTVVNSTTENETKKPSSGNSGISVNVTPCQVAEVTSASSLLSPKIQPVNPLVIKQESVSLASGSSLPSAAEPIRDGIYMPSGQSTAVSSTGKYTFN